MKDQIVENIKEIIKNWGSATEHITSPEMMYVFVEICKLIEQEIFTQKIKDDFKRDLEYVQFYRDWIVHSRKDRFNLKIEGVTHIKNHLDDLHSNITNTDNRLFSSFCEVILEVIPGVALDSVLREIGLGDLVTALINKQKKREFGDALFAIICNQAVRVNLDGKWKEFTFLPSKDVLVQTSEGETHVRPFN